MIEPILQAKFRDHFNPDGSELRKMQLRLLEMLKYIDRVCQDNNITYWLSSGTCLGAVRHRGFIPWDDDVDIEMLEKDYKRLRKVWKNLANPPYVWQDNETDCGYTAPYAKIRDKHSLVCESNRWGWKYQYNGLYIDVFHIRPSSSLFIEKLANFFQFKVIWRIASIKKNWVWNLVLIPIVFVFNKMITPIVNAICYIGAGGQLRHAPGSCFLTPRRIDDVCSTIQVPFEDAVFPIPIGYDSYLRKMYGNYNDIPPLESIHPHVSKIEIY